MTADNHAAAVPPGPPDRIECATLLAAGQSPVAAPSRDVRYWPTALPHQFGHNRARSQSAGFG